MSANIAAPEPSTITFDFIRSPSFRVVHVDGAFGGVTPHGLINAAFYSEYGAIPTRIVQDVGSDGSLGKESAREGTGAVIRELEFGVMMSVATAKSLRAWLDDKITKLEELQRAVGSLSTDKEGAP